MKYILELIIATVVIFFLWNFLKRLFFASFYKFPKQEQQSKNTTQTKTKDLDSKLNWDAETVEYEEIKENKDSKY